jgi:hypothetical protein
VHGASELKFPVSAPTLAAPEKVMEVLVKVSCPLIEKFPVIVLAEAVPPKQAQSAKTAANAIFCFIFLPHCDLLRRATTFTSLHHSEKIANGN